MTVVPKTYVKNAFLPAAQENLGRFHTYVHYYLQSIFNQLYVFYVQSLVKYGVRSPKFIWAPCEQ